MYHCSTDGTGRKEGGENRKNSDGGFVLIFYIIITQTKAAAFVTDQDHYLSSKKSFSSGIFSRASLTVRILRYEIEKGLRAVYC